MINETLIDLCSNSRLDWLNMEINASILKHQEKGYKVSSTTWVNVTPSQYIYEIQYKLKPAPRAKK